MSVVNFSFRGPAKSGKDELANALLKVGHYRKAHFAYDLKRIAKEYFGWNGFLDAYGCWDGGKEPAGRHLLQQLGTEVGRAYHENIWLIRFLDRVGLPRDMTTAAWTLPGDQLNREQIAERGLAMISAHGAEAAKPFLMAFLEFGWDGKLDARGTHLVAGIMRLANEYGMDKWASCPLTTEAFLEKVQTTSESATKGPRQGEGVIVPDTRFPNELDLLHDNGFVSVDIYRPGIERMNHASETSLDGAVFHVKVMNDGTIQDLFLKAMALYELAPRLAGTRPKETIVL